MSKVCVAGGFLLADNPTPNLYAVLTRKGCLSCKNRYSQIYFGEDQGLSEDAGLFNFSSQLITIV